MKKFFACLSLCALMAIWTSCADSNPFGNGPAGGGGGGGGGGNGTTIGGVASKGPLNGAAVTVYAVTDATGANGASLGTGTTDATGKFSIKLSSTPTGPFRVSVTGGTFVSEVDGTTVVTNSATLTSLITDPANIPATINVTLATSMLDAMAQGYAAGKTPPSATRKRRATSAAGSSCSGGVTAGMGCATPALGGYYGGIPSSGGSGFGGTPTIGSATDIDAFKIGLLSGAVAVCANKAYPTDPGKFFNAMFQDASDLTFDGKLNGNPIYLDAPANTKALSSTALTTDFLLCLNEFVNTSTVLAGAGIDPTTLSGATGSIDSGVTNSPLTPKALGLAAGGSGAIATLAFNGKQYLFVAARTSGVVVIDITDPTATNPMIKDWANLTTVLSDNPGNSAIVGGVVPIIGTASHGQIVAFAYSGGATGKKMALLNADLMVTGDPTSATDQAAIVDIAFTPTWVSTSPESVSGGSGFVLGGISDPGRHGVWLATVDGYQLLDVTLASPDFTTKYGSFISGGTTSGPYAAENVGGDIPHGYLLGGNYDSIELVDLVKGPYLMDSTTLGFMPFGTFPNVDANSVDDALQVGVETYEDTSTFTFLNMNAATRTDAAAGASFGTFAIPQTGVTTIDASTSGYRPTFSGSAVDSTTHLGLLMAGYSTDLGVFQIQDPASVASGGTWAGASNWSVYGLCSNPGTVIDPATGCTYSIARDPHAVGAIFNIGNAKAYGYLLDGCNLQTSGGCAPFTRLLQVDMAAFLAASTANQPTGDPGAAGGSIMQFTWTVPAAPVHGAKAEFKPVHKH